MIADAATFAARLFSVAALIGVGTIFTLRPSTDRPEDVAHALAGEVPDRVAARITQDGDVL